MQTNLSQVLEKHHAVRIARAEADFAAQCQAARPVADSCKISDHGFPWVLVVEVPIYLDETADTTLQRGGFRWVCGAGRIEGQRIGEPQRYAVLLKRRPKPSNYQEIKEEFAAFLGLKDTLPF